MQNLENPFDAMLPQAMVDELLAKGEGLSANLLKSIQDVSDKREDLRKQLNDSGLLLRDNDLPSVLPPTTCGVDGASILERLMSIDLIACAAVAIEGLTPPSEKRHWEDVRHRTFIHNEMHNPDSGIVMAGIMWQMELDLAANAPHNIVFIDGSLTGPIIKMNAAVNKAEEQLGTTKLGEQIVTGFNAFLKNYHSVVCSDRTTQFWVGMPKYTSKRELGNLLNWSDKFDDRSLLTSILESGEFTKPVKYEQPHDVGAGDWHLKFPKQFENDSLLKSLWKEIKNGINQLHVIYYKPHKYTPVLRVEVPASIKSNQGQLRMILDAIKFQCPTPSIIEPYPLFIADRIVKEVSKAVPAVRQIAMRKMTEEYTGDLSAVFFGMHSYRTENTK